MLAVLVVEGNYRFGIQKQVIFEYLQYKTLYLNFMTINLYFVGYTQMTEMYVHVVKRYFSFIN